MRRHVLSLVAVAALAACMPNVSRQAGSALYMFRPDISEFVELGPDLQPSREIPFALPAGCGLGSVIPAPLGPLLAIELNCPSGPAVILMNVDTAEVEQPITNSDSHLLAWAPAGDALYLKIDSVNRPRVVSRKLGGGQDTLPISELTYDLSPAPSGDGFLFTFSQGMGLGSEMLYAKPGGTGVEQITADPENYLALAQWSPDGQQIAFVRVPDSATPFTVGELAVMNVDGTQRRILAKADAGHGFSLAWSPDGRRIAFVVRENPDDVRANVSAGGLVSNLYLAGVNDGEVVRLTNLDGTRVESPIWEPDGEVIAFTAVADDRMSVFLKDVNTGEIRKVPIDPVCCAAWVRN